LAILNPEHLLEQADRLITSGLRGQPRQVDLRRAVSAAYYAVFHAALILAADQFVGVSKRATSQYSLVYRSVDHRSLRDLCVEVAKQNMASRFTGHIPGNGFGSEMQKFATIVLELQRKRQSADYDPFIRVEKSDAQLAVSISRSALMSFRSASAEGREAFLSLLLFDPR
jgi:hypothetical protein